MKLVDVSNKFPDADAVGLTVSTVETADPMMNNLMQPTGNKGNEDNLTQKKAQIDRELQMMKHKMALLEAKRNKMNSRTDEAKTWITKVDMGDGDTETMICANPKCGRDCQTSPEQKATDGRTRCSVCWKEHKDQLLALSSPTGANKRNKNKKRKASNKTNVKRNKKAKTGPSSPKRIEKKTVAAATPPVVHNNFKVTGNYLL